MQGNTRKQFDLSGRVAVVTGGGSGLGREFSEVLAEFGADVVCPDLHLERAKETCALLEPYGHRTLPLQADVSQYKQVRAMFRKVEDAFGRVDVLVNNAGIGAQSMPIHRIVVARWHRVIDIDLNGVFYCMKEGLRLMLEQQKGSIINIASIAGLNGCDPDIIANAPYVAAKAGVIGLTKQGAAEYGRHGIRVNCIAPGWHTGTRLAEAAGIVRTTEEVNAMLAKQVAGTPLRRTGQPAELKGLLLYLASDASSFVTGQIIAHDGGWSCW